MQVQITLKAVTVLSLLPDNIKNRINKLSALSVMTLGPVVTSTRLPKHKVVRAEDLPIGSSPDTVHGTRLQIHEDSPGHETATGSLIVVDIDALQLQVRGAYIAPSGVDAMLITDHLPELGTNLVATLATLNVEDLPHLLCKSEIHRVSKVCIVQ
jgi:hypothetical protein